MDNFNLKKFIVENKLARGSRLTESDSVDFELTNVNPDAKTIREEMLKKGLKVIISIKGKVKHNEMGHTGYMMVSENGMLIGVAKSSNKAQDILKFVEDKFKNLYDIEKRPSGGDFWEFNMTKK